MYLVHFDVPYAHARHYTRAGLRAISTGGWPSTPRAGARARLMAVITQAGIGWTLARTWEGSRALKRQGGASRRCPICRAKRNSRR